MKNTDLGDCSVYYISNSGAYTHCREAQGSKESPKLQKGSICPGGRMLSPQGRLSLGPGAGTATLAGISLKPTNTLAFSLILLRWVQWEGTHVGWGSWLAPTDKVGRKCVSLAGQEKEDMAPSPSHLGDRRQPYIIYIGYSPMIHLASHVTCLRGNHECVHWPKLSGSHNRSVFHSKCTYSSSVLLYTSVSCKLSQCESILECTKRTNYLRL